MDEKEQKRQTNSICVKKQQQKSLERIESAEKNLHMCSFKTTAEQSRYRRKKQTSNAEFNLYTMYYYSKWKDSKMGLYPSALGPIS